MHAMFLPKLRSTINKMPYPPLWYCTQICFSLKNSLHSKLSVTMSPCSWNSLVLPHSASPWCGWFDGMVAQPFEDSVTGPAGWQQVAGRGKVLQKAVYALNQHPVHGCFSHSHNSWVHESMGGSKSGTTYNLSYWPTGRILASSSHDLTLW